MLIPKKVYNELQKDWHKSFCELMRSGSSDPRLAQFAIYSFFEPLRLLGAVKTQSPQKLEVIYRETQYEATMNYVYIKLNKLTGFYDPLYVYDGPKYAETNKILEDIVNGEYTTDDLISNAKGFTKWSERNQVVRYFALMYLDSSRQEVFIEVAKKQKEQRYIRFAALQKMSETTIINTFKEVDESIIRTYILGKLSLPQKFFYEVALDYEKYGDESLMAIDRIVDVELLEKLMAETKSCNVMSYAIERCSDLKY